MEYSGLGALLTDDENYLSRSRLSRLPLTLSLATEARFESGPEQTALIELYTSEGCSSCPPAEAWMSHLKDDPGLWKQFVPIAFHVDYWDRLGWRDRFSSKRWTERQGRLRRALAKRVGLHAGPGRERQRNCATGPASDPSRRNDKKSGVLKATSVDGKTFAHRI